MTTVTVDRAVLEQALAAMDKATRFMSDSDYVKLNQAITALRAALEQQEQATGKDSLQVEFKGGGQIAIPLQLTANDLAWLETRRLVRVWKELGEMRWMGADDGWDRAIEAVRARLDKECQDVLAWKEKVEASEQTAAQLLQKLRGMKDDRPKQKERGHERHRRTGVSDYNGELRQHGPTRRRHDPARLLRGEGDASTADSDRYVWV